MWYLIGICIILIIIGLIANIVNIESMNITLQMNIMKNFNAWYLMCSKKRI